jgi:hypothetical protein
MHGFLTSAISWAWDLQLSSDATILSRHQFLRNMGYKCAVEHFGYAEPGSGFSWRRADNYSEPIGLPSSTSAGAWVVPDSFRASWRDVYVHGMSIFETYGTASDEAPLTQGMLDGPSGQGGFGASTDVWLPNEFSTAAYVGVVRAHFATLAWGVDHAYPGAAEAYNLLVTNLSMVHPTSVDCLRDTPRYVVTPRAA